MKRRGFLVSSAGLLFTLGVGMRLWLGSPLGFSDTKGSKQRRGLFPKRYRLTLLALLDRLVPRTSEGPGAIDVGVMAYIERALKQPGMSGHRRLLLHGAIELDRAAKKAGHMTFAKAPSDVGEGIIQDMLAGVSTRPQFAPRHFVRIVMALTMEGMFADPCYGGNHNGSGWQLLGYGMHPPTLTCEARHL